MNLDKVTLTLVAVTAAGIWTGIYQNITIVNLLKRQDRLSPATSTTKIDVSESRVIVSGVVDAHITKWDVDPIPVKVLNKVDISGAEGTLSQPINVNVSQIAGVQLVSSRTTTLSGMAERDVRIGALGITRNLLGPSIIPIDWLLTRSTIPIDVNIKTINGKNVTEIPLDVNIKAIDGKDFTNFQVDQFAPALPVKAGR